MNLVSYTNESNSLSRVLKSSCPDEHRRIGAIINNTSDVIHLFEYYLHFLALSDLNTGC